MKKQVMLNIIKKAYPIEITRGESLLDEAIWTISVWFIRCMDATFPLPDSEEIPEEPWFTVVMAITELLLKDRKGRVYFTENSFPFLAERGK